MRLKLVKIISKFKLDFLKRMLYRLYHSKFEIRKGNFLKTGCSVFYKSRISVNGKNNTLHFEDNSFFDNISITIKGNNNKIHIGSNSFANMLGIVIEGDNNTVIIGDNFFVYGKTKLYIVDGTDLIFGNDCMLSDNIEIRTTDNHGIFDIDTGNRINYEKNIHIGNHVWIGMRATILKGVNIPDGCIIGACSIISKSVELPNCCVVGTNVVAKRNVCWTMERKNHL